jgi:ketosteroid isomerase-like protein
MDFDPLSISTYFQRFINHFFNNFKFNIMKKLLLNALFMGLTTLGFAQTTFTEATFKDMMQRYQKQTVEFLKTETTTDFLFIGVSGESMDKESFITFVQGASEFPTNEFTNIKIRQYDNTAIVTGIWSHSHRLKFNNSIVSYKEAVTETFVRQNGKWLYASHQGGFAPTIQADEEAAIKKLLVDERNAFYTGDKEALAKTWKIGPTTFINASYPNGNQFYRNPEAVQKSIADFKRSESIVGNITSSKIKVYGNNAIADLEVTANYKNGTEAKEHNIVVLEKEGDTWKIVGNSVHGVPKDKADEEAAIKKMLEEEKKASDAGDFKAYKSHWVEAPYVSFLYNGLSFVGDAFWKSAEEKFANRKPTNNTTTRSDWSFAIRGGTAFVTFSQKTENPEKNTTNETYEERYVEKVNGEWKMVNMTAIKKAN